jgi:hypothetical protein
VITLKLLFDEDVDHRILRGLLRAHPQIDVRTVPEVGLGGRPDREVLAWAAADGRLLVTQDVHTMTAEHSEFVQSGKASGGVVFILRDVAIGRAISDLALICGACTAEDWVNRTDFLPL